MAIGAWQFYNDFKARAFEKISNLNGGDVIKVALVLSTSNAIDAALVGALYSALTHEVAAGFGYATGGVIAASPTITGGGTSPSAVFSAVTVSWTAAGGDIVARAAVLYDATSGDLIAFSMLNLTPGMGPPFVHDLTITNGVTFDLALPSIFTAM